MGYFRKVQALGGGTVRRTIRALRGVFSGGLVRMCLVYEHLGRFLSHTSLALDPIPDTTPLPPVRPVRRRGINPQAGR